MTKRTPPRKSRRNIESPASKRRTTPASKRKRAAVEEDEPPRSRRPTKSTKSTTKVKTTKSKAKTSPKRSERSADAERRGTAKRASKAPAAKRASSPPPAKRASSPPPAKRASKVPARRTAITRKSATLSEVARESTRRVSLRGGEEGSTSSPTDVREATLPQVPSEPAVDSSPDTVPPVTARFQVTPPSSDAGPAGPTSEPDTRRSRRPRRIRKPSPAVDGPTSRAKPASNPPLVAGYDLDDDEAAFVAPIGPTEVAQSTEEEQLREAQEPQRVEALEQQIRDLESRLDQMIGEAEASHAPTPEPEDAPNAGLAPEPDSDRDAEPRDVVASHQYLQGWRQKAMRDRSEEVDDFGLDPAYEERAKPFLEFLHRHYFRVNVEGTRNIPSEGRCLIVGNHSGGPLPYDGLVLRTAVRREHPTHRELRWLAEDFIYYLPFVGTMMSRLGAVRACQENAERVLRKDGALLVFPEGEKGVGKLYRNRYRLQRFGRGGYVRLGLRTRTPIIPVAIVGAEEANPVLYRVEYMAKALGLPFLPVTPTFPALGAVGLLPAPTKWTIRFGDPITFDGYGPQAADDEILVRRLSDQVRGAIQSMLDRALSDRRSIWFG